MSDTEVFPTGDEVLRALLMAQIGVDLGEVERSTFLNAEDYEQMLTRPLAQSRPGAVDPAAFEPIVTGYEDIVLPSRPRLDRALQTFPGSEEHTIAQWVAKNKSPSAIRDQFYNRRLEKLGLSLEDAATATRDDVKAKVAEANAYADRMYNLAVPFYEEMIEFETAVKQLAPEAAQYAQQNPDAGVYRKPITEDSAATKKYRDLGLPTPVDQWKLSDFGEGNGGANADRLSAAIQRVNELTAPNPSQSSSNGFIGRLVARGLAEMRGQGVPEGSEGPPVEREYFDLQKYYDELAEWRNNARSTGQAAAAEAGGLSPALDLESLLGASPGIGQREALQPTLLANPDAAEMESRREMATEAAKAAAESIAGVKGRAAGAARSIAGPDSGGVYPTAFPPVDPVAAAGGSRYQAAADAAAAGRGRSADSARYSAAAAAGAAAAAAAAGRGRSADSARYGAAADADAVGKAVDAAGGSRYQSFADELAEIAAIANGRQAESGRYGAAAEAYASRGQRADSARYQDAADMLADAELRAAGIADGRQADSSRYQAAAQAAAEATAEAARTAAGSRYAAAAEAAAQAAAAARGRGADSARYAAAAEAAAGATARAAAGGDRYDAWVQANDQNMVPPTPMDNWRYNGKQVMPNTPMSNFRYDGRQTPPNTPMDNWRYNGDQVMPNTSMGNWREAAAKALPDPSMDNWRYNSEGLGGAGAGAVELSSVPMDNWRYNGQLKTSTPMGNYRGVDAKGTLAAAIAAPQPAQRPKMPADVRAALDEYKAASKHKDDQERFARYMIEGSGNVGIWGPDSPYAPSRGLNGRGVTPLVAALRAATGR